MSMFWGLSMKPNRKYSQMIVKSFHLSSIAIDEGESAKLYLTADKQKYVVATVSQAAPQVMLDLNFSKGDNITFQTTGDATVSLLGYLHDIEDSGDEEDDDSIDEEEYAKVTKALSKAKKGNESSSEEEEDDDDDDEDVDDSQLMKDLLSGENSSGNEEDDQSVESGEEEEVSADSDSELDSDEEEDPEPKPKQAKLEITDKKQQAKGQNGVAKNEQKQKAQKDKKPQAPAAKEDSKKNQKKANEAKPAGGERVLSGGVKVDDVRVGNGPEAKQGKRVSVYYLGRLKSNNKVFDSMQKGAGFKFSLGAGEVIKGWDVGVSGMKVGGKRRITCPPHMAYGARGSPPAIPPNSTLVFDVELKGVN